MALNVILLASYTFGCHSLRHLIGGQVDCFSCARGGQARFQLWRGVSALNRHTCSGLVLALLSRTD